MSRHRPLLLECLEQRQLLSVGAASTVKAAVAGSTFAKAGTIALAAPGDLGTQAGQLKKAGQTDYYRITTPLAGNLVVREVAGPGSTFATALSVYDASQHVLTSIYPADPAGTYTSRVVIPVAKGGVYYVKAAAVGKASGAYSLQFGLDDFGDKATMAATIPLFSDGSGSWAGAIDYSGDVDMFQITAQVTGTMGIQQVARQVNGKPSALDSYLSVYDSTQTLLMQNNDDKLVSMTLDSLVTIPVTAGSSYYIAAAGFAGKTGAYSLVFNTDVAGQSFATATPITIPPDPNNLVTGPVKTQAGTISYPGDVQMYSVIAPVTGHLTILQTPDASKGSTLASHVYVYDANQKLIWQNQSDFSLNSRITLDVAAGAKYYVQASAHNGTTGAYLLQFSTVCTTTDDFPNTFALATPVASSDTGSGTQAGRIDYLGDVDYFSIVPPASSTLVIRETPTSGGLVPSLSVFDSGQVLLGQANGGTGTAQVTVTAGSTYYVVAGGGINVTTGQYTAGQYTLQWFEYPPAGQISGSKWNDLNGDGVWDSDEPGLDGWKIYIDRNGNGRWDANELFQITSGGGHYTFKGLAAGTYSVGEVPQANWTQTFPAAPDAGNFASLAGVQVPAGGTAQVAAGGEQRLGVETLPVLPPQYDLQSLSGYLTAPASGDALDIAEKYMIANAAQLGLTPGDLSHVKVTDRYTDADSGITHIYLRQEYNGLEVSNANFVVDVARDGRLINIAGGFVPGLSSGAGALSTAPPQPQLTAIAALHALAAPLGLADTCVTAAAGSPAPGIDEATTLTAGGFSLDPIPAKLQYVPKPGGGVALVWDFILRTPDGQHWYDASADTSTGQLLFANDWVDHASYNVYALPTESPLDGARTVVTESQDVAASPFGWHDTNGLPGAEYTDTRGNNVFAQEDHASDDSGNGFRPDGGAALNFDYPIDFTQAPAVYESAAITSLFYWNNIAHDIHEAYGFTEAAGNFQVRDYTGKGLGNDPVLADAQDGGGMDNANFATPPDGMSGRMQMYLFDLTAPQVDGDLDAEVMVHEYGHGVSNRLVGGPANANALDAIQSGGMGEGWSDWWSLMFLQKPTDTKMASYPVGNYVMGLPATGPGIRQYPYSFDKTIDPMTYGHIVLDNEVHDEGEVWCATLWDMNWLLIDKHGYDPNIAAGYSPGGAGNVLALKLVMDALKLTPANPTFLQGRDSILLADQLLTGGANQTAIWTAFARRGMGFSAKDGGNADSTTNVKEAFDMPPRMQSVTLATPTSIVTGVNFGNQHAGGPILLSATPSPGLTSQAKLNSAASIVAASSIQQATPTTTALHQFYLPAGLSGWFSTNSTTSQTSDSAAHDREKLIDLALLSLRL